MATITVDLTTSTFRQVAETICVRLPVLAVERFQTRRAYGGWIKAARIYTEAVRVRSRHVEGFYAAVATEIMLRRAGIEGIARQIILSSRQAKRICRNDEVLVSRHAADTAIALG